MKETAVKLSDVARHFDDFVERATCEGTTLVLVKDGSPVARLVPEARRRCSGRELAAAISKTSLRPEEAAAWHDDMQSARETLREPTDKWR